MKSLLALDLEKMQPKNEIKKKLATVGPRKNATKNEVKKNWRA
jgi:hypothetical protein